MHVNVFDFSQLLAQSTERYLEFVRVSSLSVGIYVLDSGALDPQKPHSEDEVYYVASGRAKMTVGTDGDAKSFDVCPGTIIFVPARAHHSFYDITERLDTKRPETQPKNAFVVIQHFRPSARRRSRAYYYRSNLSASFNTRLPWIVPPVRLWTELTRFIEDNNQKSAALECSRFN